jgi:hypothetical protein
MRAEQTTVGAIQIGVGQFGNSKWLLAGSVPDIEVPDCREDEILYVEAVK